MSESTSAPAMAAFVGELAASGVTRAVIAPGSRSTPITLALAAHPHIDVAVTYDERRAGFCALGAAKVTGIPVAIVCTSGTAAANLHPCAVEADLAGVPLILCTTDRPPELHGRGAAQTVDQQGMFGRSVRMTVDAGVPTDAPADVDWFRHLACRLVATATSLTPGPVHLNLPLRPPLAVRAEPEVLERPGTVVHAAHPAPPDAAATELLARTVRSARRGLLVCGWTPPVPEASGDLRRAVAELALATGWPVVAEATSQVRFGSGVHVVSSHDAVCRAGARWRPPTPDVVVRVGGWPISTPLGDVIGATPRHVHVATSPGWSDPDGVVSDRVTADPAATLGVLADACRGRCATEDGWSAAWHAADVAALDVLAAHATDEGAAVAGATAAAGDACAILVVGPSMPLRDVDTHTRAGPGPSLIVANRGANGIDGVVSTAVGAAWATAQPVVAVCGDVTFAHDAMALGDAVAAGVTLAIVVVDNGGGGIFSFLPQADMGLDAEFERLFRTPPRLGLADLAAAAGAEFATATPAATCAAVEAALARGGVTVVTVDCEGDDNVHAHHALWATVAQRLEEGTPLG